MNAEILLNAIGEIDDKFIIEAHAEQSKPAKQTLRRRIAAIASIAAAICIMVTGCFYVLGRFDYLLASCGSYPGTIVNGTYYYAVPHDGVYRYTPEGTSEKLLGKFWYDTWDVNNYGVYYKYGRSLYVLPHETGKSQKLYTASLTQSSHIGFTLFDGNVIVTIYNKRSEIWSEVLLDGKSGEEIKILIEPSPYDESLLYSHSTFTSGDRTLTLSGKYMDATADLLENGVSILPEGYSVFQYPQKFGDILVFNFYNGFAQNSRNGNHMMIIRPNGNDAFLEVDYNGGLSCGGATADGRYLFAWYVNAAYCIDGFTGELWELPCDAEHDFCEVTSDGQYAYTCAPWSDIQTCWKILYEDEKPAAMQLVANNIVK